MYKISKHTHTNKRRSKLPTVILASVLLLLIGVMVVYYGRARSHTTAPVPQWQPTTKVDLSPATPEEVQDSNQHKEDTVKGGSDTSTPTSPTAQNTAPSKKSVSIIVVSANQAGAQIEVRSYVSGVIEEGGTCTATFTKGQLKLSRQSSGAQDATTTVCGRITVPTAEFPEKGSWNMKVEYASPTAAGESSNTNIEVN